MSSTATLIKREGGTGRAGAAGAQWTGEAGRLRGRFLKGLWTRVGNWSQIQWVAESRGFEQDLWPDLLSGCTAESRRHRRQSQSTETHQVMAAGKVWWEAGPRQGDRSGFGHGSGEKSWRVGCSSRGEDALWARTDGTGWWVRVRLWLKQQPWEQENQIVLFWNLPIIFYLFIWEREISSTEKEGETHTHIHTHPRKPNLGLHPGPQDYDLSHPGAPGVYLFKQWELKSRVVLNILISFPTLYLLNG